MNYLATTSIDTGDSGGVVLVVLIILFLIAGIIYFLRR
jgi:LPXTG-motif cell wall-anchored protein